MVSSCSWGSRCRRGNRGSSIVRVVRVLGVLKAVGVRGRVVGVVGEWVGIDVGVGVGEGVGVILGEGGIVEVVEIQ